MLWAVSDMERVEVPIATSDLVNFKISCISERWRPQHGQNTCLGGVSQSGHAANRDFSGEYMAVVFMSYIHCQHLGTYQELRLTCNQVFHCSEVRLIHALDHA